MFSQGVRYEYGRSGCEVDLFKAVQYYFAAAEQNEPAACAQVASMLLRGDLGVVKNLDLAMVYLRKGAKRGSKVAQNNLGDCYYWGENGVVKDRIEAFDWFCLAAEQNYECALYRVA